MKRPWYALFLFFFLFPWILSGQKADIDSTVIDTDRLQVLRSQRGDIFFGKTQSLTSDSIFFVSQEQILLTYSRNEVAWLGKVENAKWLKGKDQGVLDALYNFHKFGVQGYENLAYSPTAFNLPKGRVEFRNFDIIYNTFDVGLSDNVSVGGGLLIPFLFIVRGKATVEVNEKIRFGASMNTFITTSAEFEGVGSHFFAIGTFGTPKHHFNITVGPAVEWGYPDAPLIITFGGGLAIARNWRVYADIGLATESEGAIPSVMFSWYTKRNRIDFGVLSSLDDFLSAFPILGYAHRF